MGIASVSDLYAKCLPAFGTDIDRCGALTLCNISPTTADELESIYADGSGRHRIIGALLESDFMGKACQIKQNGFYDWIMANRREWGTRRLGMKPLRRDVIEIMPFVQMERRGPINNYYWTLTAGTSGAGTAPNGATYDYTATVTSQTGIPADARWFPAGITVYISGKTAGGTHIEASYKIVDVAVSGANHTIYAVSQNTASFLPAAAVSAPETGLLRRGVVNVNDYERYCAQIPGLNTKQMVPFWVGTTRWTSCQDDLVNKYLDLLRQNNPRFREFGDIEAVELNRQLLADFQQRHAEAFFYQKALPNQTLTDYDQLEQITIFSDDNLGNYIYNAFEGRCIGRRANPIGIYEQLAECGRVKDLQGQILNIPELQVALYNIKRQRESNGIPADVIEIYTDSFYAVQVAQGFLRYFAFKSEGLLRLNMDISSGGTGKQGPLGFWFTEFSLDYPQVRIRLVTHPYFDDLIDAHKNVSATLEAAGRKLWILDWVTNYQAVIESNSVNNVSGDLKTLAAVSDQYLCTMKVPQKSVKLNSLTYTNVSECPQASLLLENIGSDVPEHQLKVSPYDDYYGDYTGNN